MQPTKRSSANSHAPAAAQVPARPLHPVRFLALFALCFLLLFGLSLAPFVKPAILAFSQMLVKTSGAFIGLCGGNAMVEGAVLRDRSTGFAIEMKNGCNAIDVTFLLWSAVLAFPASWKQKAKGILWGTLAIHVVNFVRFVSLFYLGRYNLSLFEFAHAYLWQSLILLDTLVVFWLWAQLVSRSAPAPHAAQ
jgi:exosortase H (IPTLxxWG-CTERM-specific)